MRTVNIHEAKTHLSRLVEQAAGGEGFIIAKAGRPMARLVPLEPDEPKVQQRLGFMKGRGKVPDDIDSVYREDIERMFYGSDGFQGEGGIDEE